MRILPLIRERQHRVTAHLPEVRPARGADLLVISFNPIGKGLADSGFGTEFLAGLGLAHVCVAEGAASQYQHLAPETLATALAPLIRDHPRTVTWGTSLGGHAALHHSAALRARAIALAPRLPADPQFRHLLKGSNPRFLAAPMLQPPLPRVADPAQAPLILHDPWNAADEAYVTTLIRPAWPLAEFLPLRGAGHGVARVLAWQGRLKPLMTALLLEKGLPRSGYDPGDLPHLWIRRLHHALDRGNIRRAHRLAARLLAHPGMPGARDALDRLTAMEASGGMPPAPPRALHSPLLRPISGTD